MSDDVVVMTRTALQDARKVLDGLETTIECLGAARLTQVRVGDDVMECAVFAPNSWSDDDNEAAQ